MIVIPGEPTRKAQFIGGKIPTFQFENGETITTYEVNRKGGYIEEC